MSQNIIILVILILLVKYFPSVFVCGRRLKAEPRNLWCPCVIILCLIISQFYFSYVSASPINFLTDNNNNNNKEGTKFTPH